MLRSVDGATKRRPLQGPGSKIECEGDERVELPIRKGHRDQPEDGALCRAHVMFEQIGGPDLRNTVTEPLVFLGPDEVAVAGA
jgi:hypothetical protein